MASKDSLSAEIQKELLSDAAINASDFHEILRRQEESKESLIDLLIQSGKCDEKKLSLVISRKYGYTLVNPGVIMIDEKLIHRIPAKLANQLTALPISMHESTLTVAFANPTNLHSIDQIHEVTGLRIKPAVAQASLLKKYIEKYYAVEKKQTLAETEDSRDYNEELDDIAKSIQIDSDSTQFEASADLMKEAHETPVIKLVNSLLIEGIKRGASDIFIEPWEDTVRVRARVDGLLEEVFSPPKSLANSIVSRIKVMSELDISEHRVPQDGRFKVKGDKREVDMRVSILPTTFGEKVCLRILDTSVQSHDISKLGFDEREQQIIKDCSKKPHGMILVTGPTGSGKTTTLYSVLKYLDDPECNITTVEDPVEYQLPGINQVNVKEHIGLTFPAALRSILRQDPDIVLIGEIRDNDTLDIAIKAALTGHLVLSTLHTNDAASSITRMVNMGLEPFLIASTVIMISAQRLVRRICPRCRQAYEGDDVTVKNFGLDPTKKHTFYKQKGCGRCRDTGYAGRTVITEILKMSPSIVDLIVKGATSDEIKNAARIEGMTTLRECAVKKAVEGETTVEEVYRMTAADEGPSAKKPKEEAA